MISGSVGPGRILELDCGPGGGGQTAGKLVVGPRLDLAG